MLKRTGGQPDQLARTEQQPRRCSAHWRRQSVLACAPHWLLALLLWLPGALSANDADVRFRSWSTDEGLSQVSAIDVLEDRQGFLWIATQDGLNRFDGHRFKVWRHRAGDPGSLSDNYVLKLAQGADGAIWAATQNGLNRLDPATGELRRFGIAQGLRDPIVIAVHAAPNGSIYASNRNGGVQRYLAESGGFAAVPALPADATHQKLLHVHADGRLLVANENELWEVSSDGREHRVLSTAGRFRVAAVLADGGLALATFQEGILLLDSAGRSRRRLRAADGLSSENLRDLQVDATGRLWIGTADGLSRLNADGSLSVWRHRAGDRHALPSDQAVALAGGARGVLWIGTWTGGFARFDPETEVFRVLRQGLPTPFGLPVDAVTAVSGTPDGRLWLGFADHGGVLELDADGHATRHLGRDSEPRLSDDRITGIHAESDGLWVGYQFGGLEYFAHAGGERHFPVGIGTPALPPNAVQAIRRARSGTLWLGPIEGGVYSLCSDCDDLRYWPPDPGGASGPLGMSINSIVETADGRLWFAVRRAGLSWYDPKQDRWGGLTANSPGALSLPHASVTALHEDSQGRLWIGTQGGGIARVERDADGAPLSLRAWGEEQGLVSSMIGAILEDSRGRLWISTTRGLCIFVPATERVDCLGDRDPALGVDFFTASAARDARGGLHFGSPGGLVSIREPARVEFRDPAPVVITDLKIGGRPEPLGASTAVLELGPGRDQFSVEFAALDYREPAAKRYGYRLLGLSEEWVETGPESRLASYGGLRPGDYTLELRTSGAGAEWSPHILRMPVRIAAAWWQTPWFALLTTLTLVGSGWSAARLRSRRLRARAIELAALVDARTAELRDSNAQLERSKGDVETAHARLLNTQQQLVLQEKMAALGTLTAGVAHEINNPTNFADGAVQQLETQHAQLHQFLRDLAGADAPPAILDAIAERFDALAEMTATAREGHQRIKRIVRDLRQFTRLDEAERKRVPIADSIQSTVNLVRTRYDRIRFDLDLDYNPGVECQPAKLGQVFMNLIVNACQAIGECPDGREGVVRIVTRAVGDSVEIVVEDNGAGMDETTRQHVFEPFFTTKEVGSGTGLGLAIVFGIVKDHGGRIEVESAPGAGTRFLLTLPIGANG